MNIKDKIFKILEIKNKNDYIIIPINLGIEYAFLIEEYELSNYLNENFKILNTSDIK